MDVFFFCIVATKYTLIWIIAIALHRLLLGNLVPDDVDFIAPGNTVPPYTSYAV